jgi:hypothetical protein
VSDSSDTLSRHRIRVSENQTESSPGGLRSDRPSSVQRGRAGAAVLGFALPVCAYFWFIHQYGANVLWHDQFDDINLISHSYSHTLGLSTLWAQHNENRIFFPNLIVLILARTTQFNVLLEEYLGGLMLVLATGLLILAHRRRSPSTPWIYYCPIAIVMLSFVQYQNALWGFQMAWYLVMAALALALFLLDRPVLNWLVLAGAIAAAVVGSFSSLQGLLIWPAGLVLLYCRKRKRTLAVAWILSAAASGALYLYHFKSGATVSNDSYSYALTHPLTTLEFFFTAIGNVVGVQVPYTPSAHHNGLLVLGVVIVGLAIWVVIAYGLHRDESSAGPLGAAVVCFGLLFAATFTEGRVLPGWGGSAGLRYATYDLLILVGCYMALLCRPTSGRMARGWDGAPLVVIRAVLVGVICLQVALGIDNGLAGARNWQQSQLIAADFTVNINDIPKDVNSTYVPGFPPDMAYVRQMAQVARTHHLSLFATDLGARYAKQQLPVQLQPVTRVVGLPNGARLKGSPWLRAIASVPFGTITKVEFRLTGGHLRQSLIGNASSTPSGWLDMWNSAMVPDGTYTLQSKAYEATGASRYSTGVEVTIDN